MSRDHVRVNRLTQRLLPDARRTITRFLWPGEERARAIVQRVEGLSDPEVGRLLSTTLRDFGDRHPDIREVLAAHFEEARQRARVTTDPGTDRRLLIGAYFTMEYAYESAALFNPSMVPAPEQDGVAPGCTRFLMSLRAVGEGHISSIVFRRGVIDEAGGISIDPISPRSRQVQVLEDPTYIKRVFRLKIIEMGAYNDQVKPILDRLGEEFSLGELFDVIEAARPKQEGSAFEETVESLTWLARSNYQLQMPTEGDTASLVIFPFSENEAQGMEDMRLVRFEDDDRSVRYYGTYTAYNGVRILPQILEVAQPPLAKIHTLSGRFAQNKGMAVFPRRLDGWYATIARADGENLYLVKSDSIRYWNEGSLIRVPTYSWEFVQIGNCGSPIETPDGWLLLTHGVGPMRRYCIGAILLDLQDPTKVVGALPYPLMVPVADERSGYVPNVVYSCGAMVHNDRLVIPYGISDAATGFATVPLGELLAALRENP